MDTDTELEMWWDVQAVQAARERSEEQRTHRCPPDMPPCPDCQAIDEDEDEVEFGG